MIRSFQFLLLALFFMTAVMPVFAEIDASDYTQTRIGMIHSLDAETKTAVISGYRYSFTGTKGYDLPSIKMYNSDFGAFALLRTGMIVRVIYRLSKSSRIVVELEQVKNSTRLGVPD